MLFWTAVINGVVAVPIMVAMMWVVSSRKGGNSDHAAALDQGAGLAGSGADGVDGRVADLVKRRQQGLSFNDPLARTRWAVVRAAVRHREVRFRTHLDQARGRALEFVGLIAVGRKI
jgi:hypothetical protein